MSPLDGLILFLIISLPFFDSESNDGGCVSKAASKRKSHYMNPKMARQSEIDW
jgi:hypothetical protein